MFSSKQSHEKRSFTINSWCDTSCIEAKQRIQPHLLICPFVRQICSQDINSAFMFAAKSLLWQATVLLESGTAMISSADSPSSRHLATSAVQAYMLFSRQFTYPAVYFNGCYIAGLKSCNDQFLTFNELITSTFKIFNSFFLKLWMNTLKTMPQLKRQPKGKILTS